jgi:hypothetical protein
LRRLVVFEHGQVPGEAHSVVAFGVTAIAKRRIGQILDYVRIEDRLFLHALDDAMAAVLRCGVYGVHLVPRVVCVISEFKRHVD